MLLGFLKAGMWLEKYLNPVEQTQSADIENNLAVFKCFVDCSLFRVTNNLINCLVCGAEENASWIYINYVSYKKLDTIGDQKCNLIKVLPRRSCC